MEKIIAYGQISSLTKLLKNMHVVLVGGCFDILHLGHIRFLRSAKQYGTLLVALESDVTLVKFKGQNRPIHRQVERAEVLAALEMVDYVVTLPYFHSDEQYARLTQEIKPNFIAVTSGDPQLNNKKHHAQLVKAKIVIIPKINTPSTTQLAKLLSLE